MLRWPSPQDYSETVQNPRLCFADKDLRSGSAALNALLLPQVHCGQHAAVFRILSGKDNWALRCFLYNRPETLVRYQLLSEFFSVNPLKYVLDFEIIEAGIRVEGAWFPVLKMRYVEGRTLGQYIQEHLGNRKNLQDLLNKFESMMATLKEFGIAHGDLQHDNILVSEGNLVLVDYDGMFIPSTMDLANHELGHQNYQHPGRRAEHVGPHLDNFSAWLIKSSLEYLIAEPRPICSTVQDSLLIRRCDLLAPEHSRTLFELEEQGGSGLVLSRRIRTMLDLDLAEIPSVNQPFHLAENLPTLLQVTGGASIPAANASSTGLARGLLMLKCKKTVDDFLVKSLLACLLCIFGAGFSVLVFRALFCRGYIAEFIEAGGPCKRASEVVKRTPEVPDYLLPSPALMRHQGWKCELGGDFFSAADFYDQAIASCKKVGRADAPQTAALEADLARAYLESQQIEKSRDAYGRAMDIYEHQKSAVYEGELASFLESYAYFEEHYGTVESAHSLYERAAQLRRHMDRCPIHMPPTKDI